MDEKILHIVTRILTNEANAKDVLAFNDWISQDEKNRLKFEQLMEYWDIPTGIGNAETPEASFKKFRQRMVNSGSKKTPFRLWAIPAAASLALLIVGTLFIYLFLKDNLAVEYYHYACQGSSYQLTLPDSTSVYLNKDSQLTYSSRYGSKDRQVELQGEAYFNVTKSDRKFRVCIAHTDAIIEVLGTKFNVLAYEDEPEIVATLEEGSILFKDGKQQVLISPDQQLTYHKINSVFNLREIDTDLYTAWKDNVYRYNRVSLQELCNELENIYEVEITISPQLKDIKVSGSFEYQQSLDEVLNVMKKGVSFKWKREENKIVIK